MSNHDIEGHVPPQSASDAGPAPSGPPDSLERQLAKEREARQLIRDRLRHTEAIAAESHALRARMAEELERVTADRDRLRDEATIAAAISTDEPDSARADAHAPAARRATPPEGATIAADLPRPEPAADAPRAGQARRSMRGAEPTMSPLPPPARSGMEHLAGERSERPLKPPVRRGPWRALAMLGGLALAGAGLAWLTGTMPSGLELAALPPAASAPGSAPAASASALASAERPTATVPSAAVAAVPPASALAAANPPRGATPLPPMSPESRLAAAPTAAGPQARAAAASVPPPSAAMPSAAMPPAPLPAQTALRSQSQLQAAGGLDQRLRKALDAEGITANVAVDPASGHVLVADPQADRALRDRTDMLVRAVFAGASLPEPQIEHRWMSPMHGERQESAQVQSPAPANAPPQALARAQPQTQPQPRQRDEIALAPPAAGLPTKHVEAARAGTQRKAGAGISVVDAEELRPVLPSGRFTAGCMEDLAGKTSNRRAALTACMKHSCCSSSTNLNSEECRAYQKAYPYTCGGG